MKYELGDRVLITAKNQPGYICDASVRDGKSLYIVDCHEDCDSEELRDCVITVEEHEIESYNG